MENPTAAWWSAGAQERGGESGGIGLQHGGARGRGGESGGGARGCGG